MCVVAVREPRANTSYSEREWLPMWNSLLGTTVTIATPTYPQLTSTILVHKPIALIRPISLRLNERDQTFRYVIEANNAVSSCISENGSLTCSLQPLHLAYGRNYKTAVVRLFGNQPVGEIATQDIQTITATSITQSSIAANSVVYDKPQQIVLQADKPIASIADLSLVTKNSDGSTTPVATTKSFSGHTITITIASSLPRKATLDLHIANLAATDNSTLAAPYDLSFTTSGGPQVTGVNTGSYGLDSGKAIVISFDQALEANQDASQFTSLLVNGVKQPASISISDNHVTVRPANDYPVCATVTVQITTAAQSVYGISGDSAYSYTSRSHCYTTFTIGTSVQGRPITAYQFGSGSSMVLYIGAMEGNEQNSSELLTQWIPTIDANPGKIPPNRTLVIIPTINPDGFAADTRLNADGIDLNRNFPANNWQTQVTEPLANAVWTNEGGPNPLSEPESQAIANYTESHRPRLTLTMHSHGGIVEANDAADSITLGQLYGSLADYRAIPTSAIGNFFNYTTTGAYEDWMNDKLGLPTLEVELQSATNPEYSRNLSALWAMAQISQ